MSLGIHVVQWTGDIRHQSFNCTIDVLFKAVAYSCAYNLYNVAYTYNDM